MKTDSYSEPAAEIDDAVAMLTDSVCCWKTTMLTTDSACLLGTAAVMSSMMVAKIESIDVISMHYISTLLLCSG